MSTRLLKIKTAAKEYGLFVLVGAQSFMLFKLVDNYIFSFNKLIGESMNPTFEDKDGAIVITDKITPYFRGYRRDDIVLFKNPFNSEANMCKRVKAVAGDVEFPSDPPPSKAKLIPQNHVWLEGDNKGNSYDSRSFGPVSTALGVGIVRAQIWPPSKIKYFKKT